ncbi:purine operon repressor, PurR [Anaerobranca californiensis DSM 14826]|uniref:Purine operon repressor, PurR n=1 Tax=Anaerobranca californiensis DSM 14826 TaxID=1120989 RepID=A0A1M6PJK6_9FIRM|nr:pur operon repressor [Anaerobranca californiensis]SHK08088.1 purine operon repressor, PurR [Anaerobranca californiensis DSM 14826]
MSKFKRSQRIAMMVMEFLFYANKSFSLNYFCEKFDVAKSSVSEDLQKLNKSFQEQGLGMIVSNIGASGGAYFKPSISKSESQLFLENLKNKLQSKERILPGGYLYYSDLIFNPKITNYLGLIFASRYVDEKIDYVLTMETKGIPIAMATANYLNSEVVVARRESKVTEGAVVTINYVTGSTRRIQSMSLNKRSMQPGKRVLIIDDFMKAGGSAKGLYELTKEFNCIIAGIGVVIDTEIPQQKMVDNYFSLLKLKKVNEITGEVEIEIGGK